jgi:uncharacterized protein (TIGR03435 family)
MSLGKPTGSHAATLILMLWAGVSWGQSAAPLEFEVVSIKPSAVKGPTSTGPQFFGCRGGPGSTDPGLITCRQAGVGTLVRLAYHMGLRVSYTKWISGPNSPVFEIAAKVPHGATKEDVSNMWQTFLKERFELAVHLESQEMPAYELVIAKGGFKAKMWVAGDSDAEPAPWDDFKVDSEGFPVIGPGQAISHFTGGKGYFVAPAGTMQTLATMLEQRLAIYDRVSRPVIDATGLAGKYDLKFWWPVGGAGARDGAEGALLLSALESQVGLKLQLKKSAPVEVLVIDHIARMPSEN